MRAFWATPRHPRPTTVHKLIVAAALGDRIHTALADEAADAVQVPLKFWKTAGSQFVGDAKTFKWSTWLRQRDGTVQVDTYEAPFTYHVSPNYDTTNP
jgi:hypothetical protein